jgi:hypothetical protein
LRSFSAFSRSARPRPGRQRRSSPRAEIAFFTGDYLTDVLTRLVNGWMEKRIDELMPWHWTASKNS